MQCRNCAAALRHTFIDLGFAPLSNAYLAWEDLSRPEKHYPLRVKVCDQCWLVQTEDYAHVEELFRSDYAYFSSTSDSWLAHARAYCDHVTNHFRLGPESHVIEVGSNDGYLLRNFVQTGVPCLGIEPTASTATAAEAIGVPVLRQFFCEALAHRLVAEGCSADLIIGNNVYAHVPTINDFTRGLASLLKPEGVVTLEFPHLLQLISQNQFDTVYHEHFSYLSLRVVQRIFSAAGMRIWDVEKLATHGGSLRVYGCLASSMWGATGRVADVLAEEEAMGLERVDTYAAFQGRADKVKNNLLAFLIKQKSIGKRVAAYGAAAKGNTLLNYAGVKPDLLPYVCDASSSKQGLFLPGSHLPVCAPQRLFDEQPDIVLVLPWNLRNEVSVFLAPLVEMGTELYVAIPQIESVT